MSVAAINGQVNIQIKTEAVGGAAPKVKAIGKDVSGVGDAASGSTSKVRSLGGAVEGLKKGIEPVEKLKGNIDSLKGTIEFATGAAALLTAGILGVIELTSESAREFTAWRGAMGDAATQVAGTVGKLRSMEIELRGVQRATDAARVSMLGLISANAKLSGNAGLGTAAARAQQLNALAAQERKAQDDWNKAATSALEAREKVDKLDASIAAGGSSTVGALADAGSMLVGAFGLGNASKLKAIQDDAKNAALSDLQRQRDAAQKVLDAAKSHADELFNAAGAIKKDVEDRSALLNIGIDPDQFIAANDPSKAGAAGGGRGESAAAKRRRESMAATLGESDLVNELAYRSWQEEQRRISEIQSLRATRATEQAEFEALVERGLRAEPARLEAKSAAGLAETIRDFSTALGESIPQMAEFAGALNTIASSWDGVASANDNVIQVEARYREGKASEVDLSEAIAGAREAEGKAALNSVGAIAKAGAEQIKNERLRAGVLAIIETGLSIASFAMYDYVGGAAHAAAALILGSVAIFGGSKSSSGKAEQPRTQQAPSTAQQPTQSITQVSIYGGWYGSQSPQENAWALEQTTRRHAGNGFARAA